MDTQLGISNPSTQIVKSSFSLASAISFVSASVGAFPPLVILNISERTSTISATRFAAPFLPTTTPSPSLLRALVNGNHVRLFEVYVTVSNSVLCWSFLTCDDDDDYV
ncbi:hypothetical protein LWI28_008536 [Acer negundo]|uniref:Uncharacterized protein n=1 Tax=Acer negundo TaxID=4023 RepID=A0AAD5I873_ACENE|nr:hypothetical protein LWI28_008536 [Acer negundo]